MPQFVRTLLPLLTLGAVILCGCRQQAEPATEIVPPAVTIQPETPPVVEAAPAPRPARPRFEHAKSIFFLTTVKPADDTAAAAKSFVHRYGLTSDDLDAVRTLPGVSELVPVRFVPSEVRHLDRVATVRIAATVAGYADVYSMKLSAGRFLTAADDDEMENVCVLKPWVAKKLFPTEDPLGQSVSARGHLFRVVGVLAQDAEENDPGMYIPIRTARRRFGDVISIHAAGRRVNEKVDLHEIIVRASDPAKREKLAESVRELLDKRHATKDWQFLWPGEPRED